MSWLSLTLSAPRRAVFLQLNLPWVTSTKWASLFRQISRKLEAGMRRQKLVVTEMRQVELIASPDRRHSLERITKQLRSTVSSQFVMLLTNEATPLTQLVKISKCRTLHASLSLTPHLPLLILIVAPRGLALQASLIIRCLTIDQALRLASIPTCAQMVHLKDTVGLLLEPHPMVAPLGPLGLTVQVLPVPPAVDLVLQSAHQAAQ